jgi:transposase-like protein
MVRIESRFQILNSIRLTGVPVAWMLSSSGTEATIQFFLNFVKTGSPTVTPAIIMSDRDKAQMNAIGTVYPDSKLLLCWWHVLRAIRMHFRTEEFPEVWAHIRELVKTPDQTKFDSIWEWLQTDRSVPQSLTEYLRHQWMSVVPLWSGTMRQKRTIFQEGDTNMLIES